MKKYAFLVGVLVLMVALVVGCGGGAEGNGAAEGDTVYVHYTGTLMMAPSSIRPKVESP